MRGFFKFVGVACTLIVVGVLGLSLIGYLEYRSNAARIEGETMATALDAITSVTTAWNPDEMEKRAHPQMLDMVKKQNQSVGSFFDIYRKLGALKPPPVCSLVNFRSNIGIPSYTLADYACKTEFENASGVIYLELLKDKDSKDAYLVTAFKIDSPLFTNLLLGK